MAWAKTAAQLSAQLEALPGWPYGPGALEGVLIRTGEQHMRVTRAQHWQRGWVLVLEDPGTQGVLTALAWGATGRMPVGDTPEAQARAGADMLLGGRREDLA